MSNPSYFGQQASDKEGEAFEIPEAGLHPAIVVGLVHLGTQRNDYNNEEKWEAQLFVAWELAARDSDGKPFVVGQRFTDSLHKKANWRKLLEAWRGKPFADKEPFDPVNLLSAKCVVTIQHGVTSNKKEYAKVVAVARPMKGQAIPDATYPPCAFHIAMINSTSAQIDIPDWMPRNFGDKLVDCIHESKEWVAMRDKELNAKPASAPKSNGNGHAAPIKGQVGEAVAATKGHAVEPVEELEEAPF